jgi:zinc protease
MITSSLLLALSLVAQDPTLPPAFEPPPVVVGDTIFYRRTLANGLEALVVDEVAEGAGTASVFMVIGAGTGKEGPAESGLAHLTEHTMYTGTARWGVDEHERQLVAWGAESNAFTREDYTLYYDHGFEATHLNEVLVMEADRLRGLVFDRDAFLHERYRLEHEEAGAFTQAEARGELLDAAIFRASTYGAGVRSAAGHTMAPQLGLAEVRAFYDRWYHPKHTAVVVAGDVDPETTLDAIELAFGGLDAGPPTPPVSVEPEAARGGTFAFASSLPADKLYYAWVGPARYEPGLIRAKASTDRMALILFSSVLDERHRDEEGTPLEVSMSSRVQRDLFMLGCGGEGAAERLDALDDELRSQPPTEGELEKARGDLEDHFTSIPVRGRPYFSLAGTLGVHAALGDATFPARWPELLAAVSPTDITAAVERWLAPEKRIDVRFLAAEGAPDPGAERILSDDPEELAAFAQDASEAGDTAGAIAAYEKLLTMNPGRMNSVIYGFYLGSLKRDAGDLEGALVDLEAALEVVDYPAVRELADEIRVELAEGGAPSVEPAASRPTTDTEAPASEPVEEAPRTASHRVTSTGGDLTPDFASEAESVMADLEGWRGLDFTTDLIVEFIREEDAYAEKLNGWYEPDTKRLVVIENDNAVMGRGTMLHEMQHALQDQSFDLYTLDQAALDSAHPAEAFRALRAIIEGEAMLAVADLMDYDFEQHTALPEAGELDEARFEKIFHYGAGLRFVRALRDAGDWPLVDAAFRNPPRWTASILHPDRYLAGVVPEDLGGIAKPECGCDEESLEGRVLGEYGLSLFLARDVATRPRSAALAARMAGELLYQIHDDKSGADRFAWYLSFYDALAAEEFSDLAAHTLELEVWSLDDTGRRIGILLDEDPLPEDEEE